MCMVIVISSLLKLYFLMVRKTENDLLGAVVNAGSAF